MATQYCPFDVVGLGVSTIDILTIVDEFPSSEGVQRGIASKVEGGGPVATALVTLAKLGAHVGMIDHIGNDWRGSLILEEFRSHNVCIDMIQVDDNISSSMASILVRRRDGKRAIVYTPGTEKELTEDDISPKVIESAKILHVNGRHWNACLKACEYARKNGVLISFDGGAHRYRPKLKELIQQVDICIVAKDFADKFSGRQDIEGSAKIILNAGPKLVVITNGVEGSWIFSSNDESFHQRAFVMKKVVDTTGCGDAYHGAFLYGLVNKYDLQDTAKFASAVAALNSKHLGGRSGLPTLETVKSFLSSKSFLQST